MRRSKSEVMTAVVVAPASPSMMCAAKLSRWVAWAADSRTISIDFHLLIDGPTTVLELPSELRLHAVPMANETAIRRRFGGMQWGSLQAATARTGPLQWSNHFPFYLDWYEQYGKHSGTKQPYEYIWFIEHDAFFGGQLGAFLKPYKNIDADLIDAFTPKNVSSWTEAFNWPMPLQLRRHKWEHVERISRRLLLTLRDITELRMSAVGEVFESSVCAALSWCTSRNLAGDGFVRQPYSSAYYNGNPMSKLCAQICIHITFMP